jgi:hypothetical protein
LGHNQLAIGGVGIMQTKGATYHFIQMNFAWNVVNMGIASYAIWNFS